MIVPEQFGAVGDGVHNDAPALNAALAASASSKDVVSIGAKVYAVSEPVTLPAGARLFGIAQEISTIRATANIPHIIKVTGGLSELAHVWLDGASKALDCLVVENAGGSPVGFFAEHLSVSDPRRDCIRLSQNNNSLKFEHVYLSGAGTVFVSSARQLNLASGYKTFAPAELQTAPARITKDSYTATGAGFLSTGARRGDILLVGDTAHVIASVDSDNQITLVMPSTVSLTADFAICVGAGYREDTYTDNSINTVEHGRIRGCASFGAVMGGLYGSRFKDLEFDSNYVGHALVSQRSDGGCFGAEVSNCYFENSRFEPIWHMSGSLVVTNPNGAYPSFKRFLSTDLVINSTDITLRGGGRESVLDLGGLTLKNSGTEVLELDSQYGTVKAAKQLTIAPLVPSGADYYFDVDVQGQSAAIEFGIRGGATRYPKFKVHPASGLQSRGMSPGYAGAGINTLPAGQLEVTIMDSMVPSTPVLLMATPHAFCGEWCIQQVVGGVKFKVSKALAYAVTFSWEIKIPLS